MSYDEELEAATVRLRAQATHRIDIANATRRRTLRDRWRELDEFLREVYQTPLVEPGDYDTARAVLRARYRPNALAVRRVAFQIAAARRVVEHRTRENVK